MAKSFAIPQLEVRTAHGTRYANMADLAADSFRQSVGVGGVNRRAEVGLIQKMLNAAMWPMGIALPPLKIDGYFGPKTEAAIRAYQQERFYVHDGRIDPHQATIRWLALDAKRGTSLSGQPDIPFLAAAPGKVGGSPYDPNFDPWAATPLPTPIAASNKEQLRANRAFSLLPKVRTQALLARRVLDLGLGNGTSPTNRTAELLMIKHFSSRQQTDPLKTIREMAGSIRQIYVMIVANVMERAKLPHLRGNFVGVDKLQDHPDPSFLAETEPGGTYVNKPVIWCGSSMDTAGGGDDFFSGLLLHECAHQVGGTPDGKNQIAQYIGDLYANNPAYAHADTAARVKVASVFENFALEAHSGTATLKVHHDASGEFDRPPIIPAGTIW